ncbi:unnamed protein product [Owenia fusiformis]|uniref:Uncharacterized protein n=1 Tax=Owenia fusiformis TaxID=6347 RepID=A0A8J1TYG8_OWEFU|nr:unnamed protein product [Owenia fusiformis]
MSRRTQSDILANEATLKSRVKELESEVLSLKRRLDELRKAKNTTVLKREREVLQVGVPFGKRDSSDEPKVENLMKQLDDKDKLRETEIEKLRKKFTKEMEDLSKIQSKEKGACNHEPIIKELNTRVGELEADKAAIMIENQDLKEKVDTLLMQLSVKEAQWCETEEQLNMKLKKQWSEKYQEWMAETERKIEALQQANTMLQGLLRRQRPPGDDQPLPPR